jgi:hypothetical protein
MNMKISGIKAPLLNSNPKKGGGEFSKAGGVAIAAPQGSPVFAASAGRVIRPKGGLDSSRKGNQLWIQNQSSRLIYIYSNLLASSSFKIGEAIEMGQIIGFAGATEGAGKRIFRSSARAAGASVEIFFERDNGQIVRVKPRAIS